MRSAKRIWGCVTTASVLLNTATVFPTVFLGRAEASALDPDEAHPGAAVEPLYAEALVAFHRGNRPEAIRVLSALFKRAPDHVEGLALQAQVFQAGGNNTEVVNTYEKLLKLRIEEPRLSYFKFELAYAYHRLKQYELARPLLRQAIEQGFNVAGCNLLLGIVDYESGRLREAEGELERAKASSEPTTAAPASYYLAMTEYQLGFDAAGTRQAYEAYKTAMSAPADQIPKGIATSSHQLLEKIAGPAWFGSVAMTGHYDSNIAIFPGQNLSSGVSAERLDVSAGIGKMSSAAATYQWVATLRFNGNLNLPSSTAEYEYETLAPSLYINHSPLSRMPWGFKLEGNFTAQGQSGGFRFPFLMGADLAGFVKWHPSVRSEFGLDFGARPQNYVPSDASGYSGTPLYVRMSAGKEYLQRWFNPSGALQFEAASTTDTTNSYRLVGFQVGNVFRFGNADRVSALLDLGFYSYSSIGRSDTNVTPRLNWLHPLTPTISLLADLWYTSNTSTLSDTYSYTRLVAGAGANLSF